MTKSPAYCIADHPAIGITSFLNALIKTVELPGSFTFTSTIIVSILINKNISIVCTPESADSTCSLFLNWQKSVTMLSSCCRDRSVERRRACLVDVAGRWVPGELQDCRGWSLHRGISRRCGKWQATSWYVSSWYQHTRMLNSVFYFSEFVLEQQCLPIVTQ